MISAENTTSFDGVNIENYKNSKYDKGDFPSSKFQNLEQENLEKLTKEYAALIYGILYNLVFSAMKTNKIMGGGIGEEVFKSLLVDEYAKSIAESTETGIETLLYDFYRKPKKEVPGRGK